MCDTTLLEHFDFGPIAGSGADSGAAGGSSDPPIRIEKVETLTTATTATYLITVPTETGVDEDYDLYDLGFDKLPECCERPSDGMTPQVTSIPRRLVTSMDIIRETWMGDHDLSMRAVLRFNFVDDSDSLRIWFANERYSCQYAHRYYLKKNGEIIHEGMI